MIDQAELKEIINQHKLWRQNKGGKKADLSEADLRRANLRRADLRRADLIEADLRRANLRRADLRRADLIEADLRRANLRWADLRRADLRWADLRRANLRRADLICMQLGQYQVFAQKEHTRIGCEYHPNKDWLKWGVDDVKHMVSDASAWWSEYKSLVVAAIETLNKQS